jgi:hypothetical protein
VIFYAHLFLIACGKPVENSGNNRGRKKVLQIF